MPKSDALERPWEFHWKYPMGRPVRFGSEEDIARRHVVGLRRSWLGRAVLFGFVFLFAVPVALILLFRFVPVPMTPQMLLSLATGNDLKYRWIDYDGIAPSLARAVIGSEDEKFCAHHGFDWDSIDNALKAHREGHRLRGASTISQQTARSLFLLPVRSWVRKGIEAYLTVLLETLWPKRRILTVYLNLVDLGHGKFGAEAAANSYFHTSAAALTTREAARLAAILPDPDDWHAVHPGPYVAWRTAVIGDRIAEVSRDGLDVCVRR